jgi:L-threonylcarbamoyladenylate synthase
MTVSVVTTTEADLALAAEKLRDGGLVAFPTETVYGLGANALDPTAVARIFEAKQRPQFDPLIVHLASMESLGTVAAGLSAVAHRLAMTFWPGPLTLVLPKRDAVPSLVTSGLDTVAVRVPDHPIAHRLLALAGIPVAAPSANPFGRLSPTRAAHVVDGLGDAVDVVVDGGPTTWGVESTIVHVDGDAVTVLRHGALPVEEIEDVIGAVVLRTSKQRPDAPGQLEQHYAPMTRLRLASSDEPSNERTGYVAFSQEPEGNFGRVVVLSPSGDLRQAAAIMFDVLHELDAAGLEEIVVELAPETGLGRAINDRMRRAAATFA